MEIRVFFCDNWDYNKSFSFGQQLCWQAGKEPGAARKGWNAAGFCNLVVQLAATITPLGNTRAGKKRCLSPPYVDQTAITSL